MISVDNITRRYGNLEVLKGITLSIARGELVSIVGPSGAGKTTLLQIIGSLERPDTGTVVYEGEGDIFKLNDARLARFRNRNVGFVFQFHQLLPEFTLLENVMMPALIGHTSRGAAEDRAKQLLDYLGLSHRLDHRPNQVSGGERQRAAVARALINEPKVLLADEPSGSLDSSNRRELHSLFMQLNREMGQTIVIVTHDDTFAADSHRIITLEDGRVIE
ncbi:MAG: ABC transporter ATP-binding protein [Muribaculaceae bacterium]|nr:ABC transporter ATP-binding protein [Muribaculaceae bacterium]MDE6321992.1 ABC transporter ATP-binding protein [Muribaculaceae bacterium]